MPIVRGKPRPGVENEPSTHAVPTPNNTPQRTPHRNVNVHPVGIVEPESGQLKFVPASTAFSNSFVGFTDAKKSDVPKNNFAADQRGLYVQSRERSASAPAAAGQGARNQIAPPPMSSSTPPLSASASPSIGRRRIQSADVRTSRSLSSTGHSFGNCYDPQSKNSTMNSLNRFMDGTPGSGSAKDNCLLDSHEKLPCWSDSNSLSGGSHGRRAVWDRLPESQHHSLTELAEAALPDLPQPGSASESDSLLDMNSILQVLN